jgi:UDP:flavonoid glycosyltransferase YjiC (YdhE family)
VSRLRSEAGLPRVVQYVPKVRLALCMWPDWFAAPQRDWPEEALATGFAFYPAPKATAERGTTSSDSDAPIVVTTGTAAGSQFAFYSMVVEALTSVRRAVVLVSPHRDHIPEKLPAHITWVPHAPFADLFRTASLVVHHGGIGTAAYALLNGVPQMVMPMRWDQFDNGNRLQRLGIGRMLSPKDTSAGAFRHAVTSIVSSPRVAARCRYWQSHVDVECGVRKAADAIESRCSEEPARRSSSS